ncbi:MAG: LicD family protein [Lentisphaerae bacterium]|nr:LicD family protein [Lentisphaerota bacterium]
MAEIHEINPLIKEELLSIYQAFASVCEKHQLKHWVAFGTMLGAVRHHGFIPWDDDFDIFMLREDYEKFLSVADKELPEYFKLVTHRNCSAYPAIFGKIQESRREVYEKIESETDYINPHGLYIDIFPLDGMPSSWIEQKLDLLRYAVGYCRKKYLFRKGKHGSLAGAISRCAGWFMGLFLWKRKTENDFAFMLDLWVKKYPTTGCKFVRVGSLDARFQRKEYCFLREIFDDSEVVLFETITVPVPKKWDAALRTLYGDSYMTPPPVEKRVSEHSKSKKAPWYYGPKVEK